jgi:Holliday junction resolvase
VVLGYRKGYSFERQVKKLLENAGYYVIRSAGSGVDGLSPDLVALSTTKKFAIECKAIESDYLAIEVPKMGRLLSFERSTGLPVYVAWKRGREEPVLVPLSMFEKKEKSFTLRRADARFGMEFHDIG